MLRVLLAVLLSSVSALSSKVHLNRLASIAIGVIAPFTTTLPSPALADMVSSPWDASVKYEVVKEGKRDAPMAKVGDLVAIRFKGAYKGNVFDDTFKSDQPYFYRAGVGSIIKGLDDSVVHMKMGDQFKLEFGGELGFGEKGKPSAPGKPRIPPNAVLEYEVLLEDLPGTQEGFIADFDVDTGSSDSEE